MDTDWILDTTGLTLSEWREMPWWPNNTEARVGGGYAGHDREIVVNFEAYKFGKHILRPVSDVLSAALPEHWVADSRGTRIEIHPSGTFAGGFGEADIVVVLAALTTMGFQARQV